MIEEDQVLNIILRISGLILLPLATMASGFAFECSSYEQMRAKLQEKYGEQVVFSGFSDSEKSQAANAIYEFWANPEQGNWSLTANKLIIFEYHGTIVNKNCVILLDSGKRHHLVEAGANSQAEVPNKSNSIPEPDKHSPDTMTDTSLYNCVPRGMHARALKKSYGEESLLQGLSDEEALIEVYASGNSWTITRVQAREVRNIMTGTKLTDDKTGQEIHQFCSSPSYSGKSWSLHPAQKPSV